MITSKVAINRKKVEIAGVKSVVDYLESNGYSIVSKNFYTRYGELDLIAQKNETVCFVEVKSRSKPKFPICNTVDYSKQKKIALAAKIFCANVIKDQEISFRFDVATVDLSKGSQERLNYIPNAFYG